MNQTKKSVIAIFEDGRTVTKTLSSDEIHHDDMLWNVLAEEGVLPDTYKMLTSKDSSYKHELSSTGREALIAASNGIMVVFVIYGENDVNDKYAIVYVPSNMNDRQIAALDSQIRMVNEDGLCGIYYVGIVVNNLKYEQIDSNDYVPEYYDELSCDTLEELIEYLDNKKSKKHNF